MRRVKMRTQYTEADAVRDAQDRANRQRIPMRIYRGLSMGCDLWYVRAENAVPPHDAPLWRVCQPESVCPNCGQWQREGNYRDCLNECRRRGFGTND